MMQQTLLKVWGMVVVDQSQADSYLVTTTPRIMPLSSIREKNVHPLTRRRSNEIQPSDWRV